jgi:2-aminomuconate deaminase
VSTPEGIVAAGAPRPVGAYAHARRAGGLLFLAGLGPRDPATNAVPGNVCDAAGNVVRHDIAAQCHAVFRNVRTVLEEAGAKWEQIVDVTVFLTNLRDDFATFNRIWGEYFPANSPARTTVEVSRLPTPIAIELKVIAAVG